MEGLKSAVWPHIFLFKPRMPFDEHTRNNNNNNLFYKFIYRLLVLQKATKLVEARQDEHENIMENKNYHKLQNMLEKRKKKET